VYEHPFPLLRHHKAFVGEETHGAVDGRPSEPVPGMEHSAGRQQVAGLELPGGDGIPDDGC
jgi:hypothetical protein